MYSCIDLTIAYFAQDVNSLARARQSRSLFSFAPFMKAHGGTKRGFRQPLRDGARGGGHRRVMHEGAQARRGCQTFTCSSKIELPGNEYGTICSEDLAIIKQVTGVSACIRKRNDSGSRKLTLAGPKEGMARAKSMAMVFILMSQIQNLSRPSCSASARSEYLAPSMPTRFATTLMQQMAMQHQQLAMQQHQQLAMQQMAMMQQPPPWMPREMQPQFPQVPHEQQMAMQQMPMMPHVYAWTPWETQLKSR